MSNQNTYFVKAVTGPSDIIEDNIPQVSFIGRSNVGKSSVINALANNKSLARSSSTPGRTREINFFMFKKSIYLVDLPGYGYAKTSKSIKDLIRERIMWYFLNPESKQYKVVLLVDAKVGMTVDDIDMFELFRDNYKDIVVVANKIDKLNKNDQFLQLKKIRDIVFPSPVIPFSAVKRIGIEELIETIIPKSI